LVAVALGAALGMGACVPVQERTGVRLTGNEAEQALGNLPAFSFQGRSAISHQDRAVNASLQWRQQGEHSAVRMSGPLGMGAIEIEHGAGQLRIQTSNGQGLEGESAWATLRAQLGFDPPISSIRYWVLGLPLPNPASGEGSDWQVTYEEYVDVALRGDVVALPRRLKVERPGTQLRLVIDRWQLGG
jgi:outer membrane lipoprotein LolB